MRRIDPIKIKNFDKIHVLFAGVRKLRDQIAQLDDSVKQLPLKVMRVEGRHFPNVAKEDSKG